MGAVASKGANGENVAGNDSAITWVDQTTSKQDLP